MGNASNYLIVNVERATESFYVSLLVSHRFTKLHVSVSNQVSKFSFLICTHDHVL